MNKHPLYAAARVQWRGIITGFRHVDPMTDMDIQELANLTAGDADVNNFERLFTKLKEMKSKTTRSSCCFFPTSLSCISLSPVNDERFCLFATDKASSMPHEQRKVHAEKVRCIGRSNSHLTK